MEKPTFISFEECRQEFGLSKDKLRELLNRKGCPMLPRRKGQNYQINKVKFSEWLDKQVR